MSKLDPIIAVSDVEASSRWYQCVFGCRSKHGGKEFDILVMDHQEVFLCLHSWGSHGHPTMTHSDISPGNGLILYYRTNNIHTIRENIEKIGWPLHEDIHLNENSLRLEFSFRDPDKYYWSVTEFHQYEG